jgi:hypothetical protein
MADAIHYFHHTSNGISLRKQSGPYDDNVRILFDNLPALFDYIAQHKIRSLDLSMVTDHGAYPMPAALVAPRLFTKGLSAVVEELRALLASNQTLTYCNLGLFADEFTRTEIQAIFEGHPTIDCVELTSNGSEYHFHMPPNCMYRRGNLYWAHFRED